MILIDAVYINKSGGKILLELLLEAINSNRTESAYIFVLDKRFESDVLKKYNSSQLFFSEPSEKGRKLFYNTLSSNIETVFCFANVPPPIAINNKRVFIYFHNILLLNSRETNYTLKERLSFLLKRTYIKYKNKPSYNWIVQTPSMKNLLARKVNVKGNNIYLYPFYKEDTIRQVNKQLKLNRNKFLYVADGVKQKNHLNLLEAWKVISNKTIHELELHLTIPDTFPYLLEIINNLNNEGVKVINHGYCNKQEITNLYSTCNYLIFPSLTESFGLPLIEAAMAGCEIIASNLPYVYDVVKPLKVFNPYEVYSIVDAVLDVVNNPDKKETKTLIQNNIHKLLSTLNN